MKEEFDSAISTLLTRISKETTNPDGISMLAESLNIVCTARLNYFGESAQDSNDPVEAAADVLQSIVDQLRNPPEDIEEVE